MQGGVSNAERAGMVMRVASLERALVDVLDRPDLSGRWEEIWRSLESVEFFDLDQVVKYALLHCIFLVKAAYEFFEDSAHAMIVKGRQFNLSSKGKGEDILD